MINFTNRADKYNIYHNYKEKWLLYQAKMLTEQAGSDR